jgi:hypothetical protein
MAKIFIVIKSGGQYEDAWSHTEKASFDRTKLEDFIKEEKSKKEAEIVRIKQIRDIMEGQVEDHINIWNQSQKPFKFSGVILPKIKNVSNIDLLEISKTSGVSFEELKQKRKQEVENYRILNDQYLKEFNEYSEKKEEEKRQEEVRFLKSIGIEEKEIPMCFEYYGYLYEEIPDYEIKEIEII